MNPRNSLILLVFALMACGRDDNLQRNQQPYDVVQEGSTQGVASTINAPGETTPPVTDTTGTNVDTTTAFTLPATASTTTGTQQPGTVAGTLPATTTAPSPNVTRPPSPAPRLRPDLQPPPPGTEATAPPPQPAPTATDTVAPTDTTGTTMTDTTATGTTGTTQTDTQARPPIR